MPFYKKNLPVKIYSPFVYAKYTHPTLVNCQFGLFSPNSTNSLYTWKFAGFFPVNYDGEPPGTCKGGGNATH